MRTVSPELVDSGEKTDTKGRKVWSSNRRREVLAAYAKSGMTQREGVKYSTLVHWLGDWQAATWLAAWRRFALHRYPALPDKWSVRLP